VNDPKFEHGVTASLEPIDQQISQLESAKQKLESAREAAKWVAIQWAKLKDDVAKSLSIRDARWQQVLDYLAQTPGDCIELFCRTTNQFPPMFASSLAERLASRDALEKRKVEILIALHNHFVRAAQNSLAEFESENREEIRDLKFEARQAPRLSRPNLPEDFQEGIDSPEGSWAANLTATNSKFIGRKKRRGSKKAA